MALYAIVGIVLIKAVAMAVTLAGDTAVIAHVAKGTLALVGGHALPMLPTVLLAHRLTWPTNTEMKTEFDFFSPMCWVSCHHH